MQTFEDLESVVRSYCRAFPTVFSQARGAVVVNGEGKEYIDFFAGAGSLNYGHNNPRLKRKLLEYVESDGITHSLDLATEAKQTFLRRFHDVILKPRQLGYRVQFTGPTGTNAVEAALKLCRKATGRRGVVYFSGAFHGMTLGALSVCGNPKTRAGAGVPFGHNHELPYDEERALREFFGRAASGGGEMPAAIVLETVQAEGGVRAAGADWLRLVEELARRHGVLLVVDDIQVGCGRTGRFFSFEEAGIRPDAVCLSKSISGYGLPMALLLLDPAIDCWRPGEHNGTFRGCNPSFVTATEALTAYWEGPELSDAVEAKAKRMRERLETFAAGHPRIVEVRGRGLIQGLLFDPPETARQVSRAAFERGLIAETAGPEDEVLKFLPPLTIEEEILDAGLDVVEASLSSVR